MARKNPVPVREKEIGRRLRQFRKLIVIGRAGLAMELGIGEPRLVSYESGSVPLPFHIAKKLDHQFSLNYEWIVSGTGDPRESIIIVEEIASKIPDKWPLSKVFDEVITPELLARSKRPPSAFEKAAAKVPGFDVKFLRTVGIDKKSTVKAVAAMSFGAFINQLPPFLYWEFYRKIQSASEEFLKSHAVEISKCKQLESDFGKLLLTDAETCVLLPPDMKLQLPGLLEQLKAKTAKTGKMSELASFLSKATKSKVPLASVSRWLSGKREPGGEITLLLQKWVELQEGQK